MLNQIIDTKSETRTFKKLFFKETINSTVSLILINEPEKFALNYNANYSGIKNGNLSGGPIPVGDNGSHIEHDDPKVILEVSNYSDDGSVISFHVKVTVDASQAGLGTITLFDQTLGGKYGDVSIGSVIAHVAASVNEAND